jgi:hypothetical protein
MPTRNLFLTSAGRRLASFGPAATLVVAMLLVPAAARADNFTVIAGDASSLQSALNQAAAHANVSGPDVVSVPAGTYTGNFTYGGDAVDLEGAGRAATRLSATGAIAFSLDAPGSTVADLSIENTQPGLVGYGLSLKQGGTVHDVELDATGNNVYGLRSDGDTAIADARFVVGAADDTGMVQSKPGTMTISRTTIEGSGGAGSEGIDVETAGGIVHASRLRSVGVALALRATFGGSLTVRDSLLVLPAGFEATALYAGDNNNTATDSTSTVAADRVTIVGDPKASQLAANVYADSAGDDFEISIHDSVLAGVKTPLRCFSTAGKGSTTADWSSLPATGDVGGGAGCTVARTNPVAGTPVFADPAGGDYHQRYDSPLIDAGDPAPLAVGDDLDGLTRPVGRVDLGAYEYQRRPPAASVSATPASPTTGQDVTFVAAASDPDPGDSPLAYSWSFDDGGTATGSSATHAFATAGPHAGTVTVTDPTGQSATAAHAVTITAPAAVTIAAPAIAPDRTAPTVTLLVRRRLSLAKALRRGIPATIGCSEACTSKVTLALDARTARRLHMARAVGARTISRSAAGRQRVAIRLTRRARAALRHYAAVKLVLRASATDRAGNTGPARTRTTTVSR